MKNILPMLMLLICLAASGQSQTKRALFIGNSYTYSNSLLQMVAGAAMSTGDTLLFDGYTPDGYALYSHANDPNTLNRIAVGNWDYVVLQEQSQAPTVPIDQFMSWVFPPARRLDSLINAWNPCAETLFYMTWGRRDGDPSFCAAYGVNCTYEAMDSLLHARYRVLADSNDAAISPVGAVWRYIRENHPSIELYQSDGSHPSLAGSYVATCSFYATIFRKNPTLITYDFGLPPADAAAIRQAAKLVVYDSLLHWNIGIYDSLINPLCLPTGIEEEPTGSSWKVFPNPATTTLSVEWVGNPGAANMQLQLYDALGGLVREVEVVLPTPIQISDLPDGIYFIRLKNHPQRPFRFIKG